MRSTLALLSLAAAALFVRTWRRTRPRAVAAAPTTDWCAIKPEWCAEEESARKNPLYKPVAHCHHELSFNKHNSSHAADLSSVYDVGHRVSASDCCSLHRTTDSHLGVRPPDEIAVCHNLLAGRRRRSPP